MVNATAASSHSKASTATSDKHPTYAAMIAASLKEIGGRSGGSRTAIIKQISMTFDVGNDPSLIAQHTKRALKKMLESGVVVHTKGEGVSTNGSFKLAPAKPKSTTTDGVAKKKAAPKKKKTVAPLAPHANGNDSDGSEDDVAPVPAKPAPKKKPAAPKVQKEDKPVKAKAAPAKKTTTTKKPAAKPVEVKTVVSPPVVTKKAAKEMTPVKPAPVVSAPAKKTKSAESTATTSKATVSPTKKTRGAKAK